MKKRFHYKDYYKVLTAIVELEGSFKNTGVHTKTIAEYTNMDIGKVNAILGSSWFSYFPLKKLVGLNHKNEIMTLSEMQVLNDTERKLCTIGFLVEYKD